MIKKAGRIILLVLGIFAITGAVNTTFAQGLTTTQIGTFDKLSAGTCQTSLFSCNQVCTGPTNTPTPQRQTTIVTSGEAGSRSAGQTGAKTKATALPQIQQLESEPASDSAILDSDKIFNLVNEYRASQGLPAFEKNDQLCALAQVRTTEISAEIQNGTLHSGLYNRNLPYWIWENAKYGSNEEGTVAWWLASSVHYQSIVGDYKYSCVKCSDSYCSELFTSFVPK